MPSSWDVELAQFLTELSEVQGRSLEMLCKKRQLLVTADRAGLAALAIEEEDVIRQLQWCLQRRRELLERAAAEGLPDDSLRSLADALPDGEAGSAPQLIREASARARLLQHHSLTNWVLVQRTMIHLAQMLEIIATGGRTKPTYSREEPAHAGGTLVDHVA
jgi:hypothetical protein